MNFLFLILKFLGSFLPKGLGDLVARGTGRLCYTFVYRKGLNNHLSNLKEVFKDKSEKELLEISKKAALNISVCLYEHLFMGRILNRRTYNKYVKGVGLNNLFNAHKEGKGVIALTAHLGNYEWGAALVNFIGLPISAISVEYRTPYIRDIYEFNRKRTGYGVFYVKKSSSGPVRFLKKGGVLAILADRSFEGSTLRTEMFGKDVSIPKGAFFLASKLRCSIVPCFSIKDKDGRYHIHFEEPFKITEEETNLGVKKYVKSLEAFIRKHPDQWLLFDKLGE
jgi:KDO2-lipid IV(A) lauroyltransferase